MTEEAEMTRPIADLNMNTVVLVGLLLTIARI